MAPTARLRTTCRIIAVLCLLVGVVRLADATTPMFNPLWLSNHLLCRGLQCEVLGDPLRLLGPVKSIAARRVPDAREKLEARSRIPSVRAGLFAAKLTRAIPEALMYFFLAFAMRDFARGHPFGLGAVRWLRRSAGAALAAVVAQPIALSLRSTLLEPALDGRAELRLAVAGDEFLAGLFLVGVVWVAAWAIDEGRRAQDELAQIL